MPDDELKKDNRLITDMGSPGAKVDEAKERERKVLQSMEVANISAQNAFITLCEFKKINKTDHGPRILRLSNDALGCIGRIEMGAYLRQQYSFGKIKDLFDLNELVQLMGILKGIEMFEKFEFEISGEKPEEIKPN